MCRADLRQAASGHRHVSFLSVITNVKLALISYTLHSKYAQYFTLLVRYSPVASKLRVTGIGFNQITQFFCSRAGISKLQNDVTYNADFVKLQVRKSRLVQDIISWIMYDTWGFVEV